MAAAPSRRAACAKPGPVRRQARRTRGAVRHRFVSDPAPPSTGGVFAPVQGERFTFDVSCMACGVIARFDRAPTFPILIQRMEMARWRVGTEIGWRKGGGALHDLRTWRACSDCAGEAA